MRRILFHVGRIPIHSYTALLYAGIVCGIAAQRYAAMRDGLDLTRVLIATFVLLVAALAGARLLYVAVHWAAYRSDPRRVWKAAEGGAAVYGGLLLAVPLSVPLLAVLNLPFGAFWDGASLTMLVGMIFARAGCLLNGCCSGRRVDGWFGMNLPDVHGTWTRRIPTQMLEGAWACVVLAGAVFLHGRMPFDGSIFLYSVAAYSAGRIVLERTRDERDEVRGVALHEALSTAFVAVSAAVFLIGWLR